MIKIRIHGLPPGNKTKSRVIIFDSDTYPGESAERLSEGSPNQNGVYECKIPGKYKNKNITLSVLPIDFDYTEINEKLQVHPLGVFHAVRLEKETNSVRSLTDKWPVEPYPWYMDAQSKMKEEFRAAKYRNWFLLFMGSIATILAVFIGWFVAGLQGLIIGSVLTIFVIVISKYSSGYARGI